MKAVKYFHSKWCGSVDYQSMLTRQEVAAELVRSSPAAATVFGLEHPKVITLGIRGRSDEDFKAPPEVLMKKGFQYCDVQRGGQATLHNPGQLVIYPILPLRSWGLGVRDYVCLLQKATKKYLLLHGVESWVGADEPGLYTEKGKIAFFGLQVSRGVSLHGLSINLTNNLEDFLWIRSCGKSGEEFDNLESYGSHISPVLEFQLWCQTFEKLLHDRNMGLSVFAESSAVQATNPVNPSI